MYGKKRTALSSSVVASSQVDCEHYILNEKHPENTMQTMNYTNLRKTTG